jgi:hypothetical protein
MTVIDRATSKMSAGKRKRLGVPFTKIYRFL